MINPQQFEQARQSFQGASAGDLRRQFSQFQGLNDTQLKAMLQAQGMGHLSPAMVRAQMSAFQNMDESQLSSMKKAMNSVDSATVLGQVQPLAKLQQAKQEATKLFSEKRYAKAADGYLAVVTDIMGESNQFQRRKEVQEMRRACHLNISLCRLQQGEYDDARDHALRVLRHDPGNLKAHFRAGKAFRGLGRPADALAHFRRAKALGAVQADAQIQELEAEFVESEKAQEIEKRLIEKQEQAAAAAEEEEEKQKIEVSPAPNTREGMAAQAKQAMAGMSDQQMNQQCQALKQMDATQLQSILESQGQKMSLQQVKAVQSMMTPEMLKRMADGGMPTGAPPGSWGEMLQDKQFMKAGMAMMEGLDQNHPMKKMASKLGGGDLETLMKRAEMLGKMMEGAGKVKKGCCGSWRGYAWVGLGAAWLAWMFL